MKRKPPVNMLIVTGITISGETINPSADASSIPIPAITIRIIPARKKSISFRDVMVWAFKTTTISNMLAPTKAKVKRKKSIMKYWFKHNPPKFCYG